MNDAVQRLLQFLFVENWGIPLVAVLGFAAVALSLPRPRGYPVAYGVGLGTLALLCAGAFVVRAAGFDIETICFYAFSGIAIVAAFLLITQRNPARAALSFALVVLSTCGLFLLQAAPFLMAATIIIYAGAIVVTFLFVLMLAQQEGASDADFRSREPVLSAVAGFVLLLVLLAILQQSYGTRDVQRALGDPQHPAPDALLGQTESLQQEAQALAQRAGSQSRLTPEQRAALVKDSHDLAEKWHPSAETTACLHAALGTFIDRDLRGSPTAADRVNVARAAVDSVALVLRTQPAGERNVNPDELRQSLADLNAKLGSLRATLEEVPNLLGTVQPGDHVMSSFSGPPPNLPVVAPEDRRPQAPEETLRRDVYGRPELPAENVGYLGRSLFTDYLLAVELGGTLLLVATIGAIAIANRRAESPS